MNARVIAKEWNRLLEDFFSRGRKPFGRAAEACTQALRNGRKILAFGNGGSAAEAQHFVAELVNRFSLDRPALRAIALTTDTSVLTSIANDAAFDAVFRRQIEALGEAGDIALGLSTSGDSPNVIQALKMAKRRGLTTIVMTGRGGGKAKKYCDYLLEVASRETPRIQEIHLLLLHLLAEEIEQKLFLKK
jgi:D-sedoheptulose 7-phosphate isomerase